MEKDKFLFERLKKGDEEAYSKLVELYGKKMYVYAVSLSGDYSLAKDIVQEVFISTYENRKKLDSQYSLSGFLYRSVYNNFINTYHKNKSINKLKESYIITLNQVMTEIDDPKDFEQKLSFVKKSIEKLPKKCREIFILSKKDGYTNQEISEILNISIKTVETQISIAFSKIRDDLETKNNRN